MANPVRKPRERAPVAAVLFAMIRGDAAGGASDPIPQGGFVRQLADVPNNFEIRGLGKLTGQGFIRASEDEAVAKQAGVPLLVQPVKGRFVAGTQFGREMGGVRKSEPPCARALFGSICNPGIHRIEGHMGEMGEACRITGRHYFSGCLS